jgi:hypothetical protein
MSANVIPVFTQAPIVGTYTLTTADTNTGGTGGTAPTHVGLLLDATTKTVASVTTTNGSQLCTVSSGGFSGVYVGMSVIGTGINPGTVVQLVAGNNLILSQQATASGTVTLTFVCNGLNVSSVRWGCLATSSTGGVVNLFLDDGTSTYYQVDALPYNAFTSGATTASPFGTKPYDQLIIPGPGGGFSNGSAYTGGSKLYATVTETNNVQVTAFASAF